MSEAAPTLVTGATGEKVAVTGVVRRQVMFAGSKSAHPAPVLVDAEGHGFPLFLVGENPLEQPTLAALEGRLVTVQGTWRNGVVRVERADLRVETP